MLQGAPGQNPFEYFTSHVQLIGWGGVLVGLYKATRFLTKLTAKIDTAITQFDEMHRDIHRQTELAEQQARRWETWMMGRATHTSHIGVEEVAIHGIAGDVDTDIEA